MTTVLGRSAVSAEGLTKRYGARRGVHDVSFTVGAGEICALLGRTAPARGPHGGRQSLLAGLLAQLITIAVALIAAGVIATRRDPSA